MELSPSHDMNIVPILFCEEFVSLLRKFQPLFIKYFGLCYLPFVPSTVDCYFALKVWNGQKAGAAAVLVADNIDEPLITMDTPEESRDSDGYIEKINIPSALINRAFGDALKKAVEKDEDRSFSLSYFPPFASPKVLNLHWR